MSEKTLLIVCLMVINLVLIGVLAVILVCYLNAVSFIHWLVTFAIIAVSLLAINGLKIFVGLQFSIHGEVK